MKALRNRFLAAGAFWAFIACAAHGAQWGGYLTRPVFGYLFDSATGRWHPLQGVPGSATVGAPVEPGFRVLHTLMLPRHAIVSTEVGDGLLLLDLEANRPPVTAIAKTPGVPSSAVASAEGTSAAFYFPDTRQVYVVRGLPEKPVLAHRIDVSPTLGSLTRMALSNDGDVLLYAGREGPDEPLYRWTPSSTYSRFLMASASIGGVALSADNSAIVADREANAVVAFWDAGGAAVRQFLVGETEGVSNPTGVAISADNRIYVANATGTVLVLDDRGRYLKQLDCSCRPAGLYPLRDSLFRLTEGIHQTLFVLDTTSSEEHILFVPPGRFQ